MSEAEHGRLAPFVEKFGLTYQLNFLRLLDEEHPLAGKRVLEIGGSNLPREIVFGALGAAQWICDDDITTYGPHNVRGESPLLAEHFASTKVFSHADDVEAILAEDYAIIDGDASDLRIEDHFDVAISICAFEHIARFAEMLDRTHAALRSGGRLLSLFQPVWPCLNGHHIGGIVDAAGNDIHFGATQFVPPWAHLLLTPPQLYELMRQRTDAKAAAEIVHQVYHSTQVNRLFFEDYEHYLRLSQFSATEIRPLALVHIPAEIDEALRRTYPGRSRFDASTAFIDATK